METVFKILVTTPLTDTWLVEDFKTIDEAHQWAKANMRKLKKVCTEMGDWSIHEVTKKDRFITKIDGKKIQNRELNQRILGKYRNMLYPQYADRFSESGTISKEVWSVLQEEAEMNLKSGSYMTDDVKRHMLSIVNGVVPFGFTVA